MGSPYTAGALPSGAHPVSRNVRESSAVMGLRLPPTVHSRSTMRLQQLVGAAAVANRLGQAAHGRTAPPLFTRHSSTPEEEPGGGQGQNTMVAPTQSSVPLGKMAVAFGWRGIALLGAFTCLMLVGGTFSVWYFTGVSTSGFVLCLVQLQQQELSSQLSSRLRERFEQASAVATLTLSSGALLMPASDDRHAALLHRINETASSLPGMVSPDGFDTYLTSLLAGYPTLKVHLATAAGAYVGVSSGTDTAAMHLQGRPPSGCLEEAWRQPDQPWLAPEPWAGPPSPPPQMLSSKTDCAWRPWNQPWYTSSFDCEMPAGDGACWSAPYAVATGAAVAFQRVVPGSDGGFGGILAVEISLASFEEYLRSLATISIEDTEVVLVDARNALLATTGQTSGAAADIAYAQPLAVSSALAHGWEDTIAAFESKKRGEAIPSCSLSWTASTSDADLGFCTDDIRQTSEGQGVGEMVCNKVRPHHPFFRAFPPAA
jgi:hypothetical protein